MGNTIFMEGFEHSEPLGRAGLTIIAGVPTYITGRTGGKAISWNGSSTVTQFDCSLANPSQLIVSWAFKRTTGAVAVNTIADMLSGSNSHVRMGLTATNQLTLTTGASGTVFATSVATIDPTGWNRIDWLANISDTGAYEVRLNGTTIITGASADQRNGVLTGVTAVRFILGVSTSPLAIDDLHIRNDNTFQPDMVVETLVPNGNGAESDLIGSDGNSVNNYLLVDELPAASADFVTSATVGDRDLYAHTDLTTLVGVPKAVQIHVNGQKSDAGAAAIIPVMRLAGGTEWEGASVGLATTAAYLASEIREVDPAGAAWTVASVNGSEFGVEIA
jgi:hypothetical protein